MVCNSWNHVEISACRYLQHRNTKLVVFSLPKNKVVRNFPRQEITVSDGTVIWPDCWPLAGVQKVGVFGLHANRCTQRFNQRIEVWFEEEWDPGQEKS